MLTVLLNVLAPVLICVGVGLYWARSGTPYNAEFVTRIVMNGGRYCGGFHRYGIFNLAICANGFDGLNLITEVLK